MATQSRREKNQRIKSIVREVTGLEGVKVKVRLGRGTAYSWVYIYTPSQLASVVQLRIEKQLVREQICGTHTPDDNNMPVPNVLFIVRGGQ